MKKIWYILLVIAVLAGMSFAGEMRTWTKQWGDPKTVEGELIEIGTSTTGDPKIVIKDANGEENHILIRGLSAEDQAYVAELQKKQEPAE